MKLSDFLKYDEDLKLEKKTVIILRWIALIGQLITIYIVHFFVKFDLPLIFCSLTIFFGGVTNIFVQFGINKNQIKCTIKDKDRYGRLIAVCFSGKININATMVREGWAIAYRYYSKDYVNEEEIAKAKKKGIWQGSFVEPYIWRKNN